MLFSYFLGGITKKIENLIERKYFTASFEDIISSEGEKEVPKNLFTSSLKKFCMYRK